ncbi:nucleotidyltransferase domain-containing protein [Flavitalea sp.]|nr:nucleotidyltransferase domain-containing protein [Flavitalea sp.]
MREIILEQLLKIETDCRVKILYACESGSRAWGFASPDSDFDVRFIYSRNPREYLRINDAHSVIDLPINELLDIGGWDLRKALRLYLKSNGPFYEWLQSPIVYMDTHGLKQELLSLKNKYFSPRAGSHHYLSMATNVIENDMNSEQVKLKKYFYALRSLLAAQWIIQNKETPPMEFGQLRTLVTDSKFHTEVDKLLELKKASTEKEMINHVSILQNWMTEKLSELKVLSGIFLPLRNETEELDGIFTKHIGYDL